MIAVRLLPRETWEARLKRYKCKPLEGKGQLNTAEWWQMPWGTPFPVPIEDDASCEEWALQKVILDIVSLAPPDFDFET